MSSLTPGERLAKVIAAHGICSRRDAEVLITEGSVTVNGQVVTRCATCVTPADHITVKGTGLHTKPTMQLWLYHKPSGLLTTHKDPQGRPTIFDDIKQRYPELPRLISVGRLDFNTEGLILLTTSGSLARYLELPNTGWVRRYHVRVFGRVDPQRLASLKNGLTLDGISYGPIDLQIEKQAATNSWLVCRIQEGKNREVRKIMEYLGLKISRLQRTSYGPFQIGNIARGTLRAVPEKVLREQLPTECWQS